MKSKNGYEEGGFLDDGASVDPVSGNEVPTGSLGAEVRDDIPAQLSEGEFVLPADVVRFIGLEKLMKMRNTAKAGLSEMEAEGQIGGSPVADNDIDEAAEIDAMIEGMDSDEDMQFFAEGGSVRKLPTYKQFTGREFGKAQLIEYRVYINASGDKINIKFINDQPLEPIPEGYSPFVEGEAPPEEEPPVDGGGAGTSGGDGGGSTMQKNDPNNPWKGITASSDSDAIKKHHQIRSDKVTRNRRDNITGLIDAATKNGEAELEHDDKKYLSSLMTEDGMALYVKRFENPQGIDKYLTEGKTEAELMQLAQTTADTIRGQKGLPDPSYTGKPTGETPDIFGEIKELLSGNMDIDSVLKKVAVLGVGLALGAPPLLMKLVAKHFDKPVEEVEKKVTKIIETQPAPVVAPVVDPVVDPVVAQGVPDRDPKLLGEMGVSEVPIAPVIAQEVPDRDPKLLGEMGGSELLGEMGASEDVVVRDFLGNVVEGGTTDRLISEVEGQIPDVVYNKEAYEERLLQEDQEFRDMISGMDSNEINKLIADEDVDNKKKDALALAIEEEYEVELGKSGILADLGISDAENTEIDQAQTIKRLSLELGLSYDYVKRAIQDSKIGNSTQLNTDFEEVAAGTSDRLAKINIMKAQQLSDKTAAKSAADKIAADRRSYLLSQAQQVDKVNAAAKAEAEATRLAAAAQAESDRQNSIIAQAEADQQNAIIAKEEADRKAAVKAEADRQNAIIAQAEEEEAGLTRQQRIREEELSIEAETQRLLDESAALTAKIAKATADKKARLQGDRTPTPTLPNTPPPETGGGGHPSAGSGGGNNGSGGYTPPSGHPSAGSGGGNNGSGGYTGGWGNSGYSQKKAKETGNGYINAAKGGLIGKADKPKVKKMRSDNTSGLAAKKKSKQKAQARKGALAAKRT